jgi:hypothetical protein
MPTEESVSLGKLEEEMNFTNTGSVNELYIWFSYNLEGNLANINILLFCLITKIGSSLIKFIVELSRDFLY